LFREPQRHLTLLRPDLEAGCDEVAIGAVEALDEDRDRVGAVAGGVGEGVH
jgi:hypothetical protein